MKLKSLSLLVCIAFFLSCSSDETSTASNSENYYPLSVGNYWTYDIEGPMPSRDSLYVANDTVITGVTFKKMKTKFMATGFFASALSGNGLRVDNSKIVLTGGLNFAISADLPINLSVSNFTILDEAAGANTELSTASGTFSQTVSSFPLTFTYSLKSIADGTIPSFTSPDGTFYSNVKKTKIVLSLKITTTSVIPGTTIPFNVTVLEQQNVLTSAQYYAKNIGMVYTSTDTTYQLNPNIGAFLPIPMSGNQNQKEFLDLYHIN